MVAYHFINAQSIKGQICGGAIPKPVESSGNAMVLRFKSDHHLTSKGFRATYTKFSPTTTTPTPTSPGKHSLQICFFSFFFMFNFVHLSQIFKFFRCSFPGDSEMHVVLFLGFQGFITLFFTFASVQTTEETSSHCHTAYRRV